MRIRIRRAVTLFTFAGAAQCCWGQTLPPPTPDQPVLFIQPMRCYGVDAEGEAQCWTADTDDHLWWPTDAAEYNWNPNFVPMIMLNPVALAGNTAAWVTKLRQYYDSLGVSAAERAEYDQRFAVEIFNFGGGGGASDSGPLNNPVEFWVKDAGDDMPVFVNEMREWMNPWMHNRLCGRDDGTGPLGAQDWMRTFVAAWNADPVLPPPKGGVFYDTEQLLVPRNTPAWVAWAMALESDPRWDDPETYVPDVDPPLPGSKTLQQLWADAQAAYGWTGLPSAWLDPALEFHQLTPDDPDTTGVNEWNGHGNRDIQYWMTSVAERAITGAITYAGAIPFWEQQWDDGLGGTSTLQMPISNYGDAFFEQRLTTGNERFGWHEWRPDFHQIADDREPSRAGWLGQSTGWSDVFDAPGGTSFSYGGPYYCDQCVKYPYLQVSEVNGAPLGAYQQDHNRFHAGSHHNPVLYPVYENTDVPAASLTAENLYVPESHPAREETMEDATIREARYALDSMGFSGVTPDALIPWILPPDDEGGIRIGNPARTVPSTRDLHRRMLMLLRSKEISRALVFNMKLVPKWYQTCAARIYEEVYGCDLAGVQAIKGLPLTPPDLDRVRNTLPGNLGAPKSYSVASVVGTDYGKSATATRVDFQFDEQFILRADVGLRLVLECEVTGEVSSTSNTSSVPQFFCDRNLRGRVYLWNWGNYATAPGWVQLDLSDPDSPGEYRFPACFEGAPFDLSMRREVTVVATRDDPGYEFINSAGKCSGLLVHASDSGDPFVSNWDLVQLAKYTASAFCNPIDSLVEPEGTVPGQTTYAATTTGADINFDGIINASDLGDFANAYTEFAPLADYNGDEEVTSDDALTFLEDFVEQID